MKRKLAILLMLGLAACEAADEGISADEAPDVPLSSLEQAAIEAGVIPDIRNVTLSGAFERQSELGVDRFCAVGNDERGYQVGVLAVFGPESKCEGLGEATRAGEQVKIRLSSKESCSFEASFDGVELQIPGSLPESCASYCTPRATFSGVSFYLVGEGDAVARSTQGREIGSLCPG
ncbi:MAG: hypothetical protein AAGE37_07360 [Pseudomonadota bacterium]